MGSFQPFWLHLLVHSWCGIGFLLIMPTNTFLSLLVVVVQLLRHVWLFATPCTAACQASLSFTISQSLLKLMSIESVIPSNHLILCHPLLLLPSVFLNIRVFSSELALHIRWPKYWSFSFSISPFQEYSGLISFKIGWLDLLLMGFLGLPRWLSGKESACQCRRHRRYGFDLWFKKIPRRRKWQLISMFLPGKSHEQRSLMGYSPWGCKRKLDMTGWLNTNNVFSIIYNQKILMYLTHISGSPLLKYLVY